MLISVFTNTLTRRHKNRERYQHLPINTAGCSQYFIKHSQQFDLVNHHLPYQLSGWSWILGLSRLEPRLPDVSNYKSPVLGVALVQIWKVRVHELPLVKLKSQKIGASFPENANRPPQEFQRGISAPTPSLTLGQLVHEVGSLQLPASVDILHSTARYPNSRRV